MVAIADFSVRYLLRTRRRSRREILARLHTAEDPVALAPALLRFAHVRRDICRATRRVQAVQATTFNFSVFFTEQALSLFRFKSGDVGRIAGLLRLDGVTFTGRQRVSCVERVCIVLRRLSSPSRWVDLEDLFGRRSSSHSNIFLETVEALLADWSDVFSTWQGNLMEGRAAAYARCVLEKGAPLDSCIGFIDVTGIFVARPGKGQQQSVYSGHKRTHMIKFQPIVTPDGLLFHLVGPIEGRRHEITLYREAGKDVMLEAGLRVGGVRYSLFGDKAYQLRPWIQVAFPSGPGVVLEEDKESFHVDMTAVYVAVEWGSKEVKQIFQTLDYTRKLKINESPVGLLYRVAVLLWNVRCCLYGGQTATFVKCAPPSVVRYLSFP